MLTWTSNNNYGLCLWQDITCKNIFFVRHWSIIWFWGYWVEYGGKTSQIHLSLIYSICLSVNILKLFTEDFVHIQKSSWFIEHFISKNMILFKDWVVSSDLWRAKKRYNIKITLVKTFGTNTSTKWDKNFEHVLTQGAVFCSGSVYELAHLLNRWWIICILRNTISES